MIKDQKQQTLARCVGLILLSTSIGLVYNRINPGGLPLRQDASQPVRPVSNDAVSHIDTSGQNLYEHDLVSIRLVDPDTEKTESSIYENETLDILAVPDGGRTVHANTGRSDPALTWADVKPLLAKNEVLLVDGRSPEAFAAGHIPGAVSLPLATLTESISTFMAKYPRDMPIVVYCGNARCDISGKLIHALTGHYGYSDVRKMPGGYLEWRQSER